MRHSFVPLALAVATFGCSSTSSTATPSDAGTGVDATADAGPPPPSDSVAQTARTNCAYDAGSLAIETQGASAPNGAAIPIDTIVVIMMENRSFDHYFQGLPSQGWTDVDVAPVGASNPGVDDAAVPFAYGGAGASAGEDGGVDAGEDGSIPASTLCFADTNHSWDGTHQEIDNGKMDGFAIANDGTHEDPMFGPPGFLSGSRAMIYYTKDDLPFMYWAAANFAIGDRYFASVPGPTWPNREYLYAATSWGETTTGAFPMPTSPLVFDTLKTAGVSWGYYQAADLATTSLPTVDIFINAKNFAVYSKNVFKYDQFTSAAAAGTLPHVVFIDPSLLPEGYNNDDEHPPAVMQIGENWRAGVVQSLMASPQWAHMAIFLLYDEHGGLYDHVQPPQACAPDSTEPILAMPDGGTYGGFTEYGVRLPFVTISPYAKTHYVSHVVYDHTSVLRFIEARFGLPALTKRDANALAPWDVFDFTSAPNMKPPAMPDVPVNQAIVSQCAAIFNSSIPTTYSQ
jgi:phospholipase C